MIRVVFLSIVLLAPLMIVGQEGEVTTVDIIHMKDGRVLRGEIILFEEEDGDITFKDQNGRTYSMTRDEYSYFEEDQVYTPKQKKVREILDRKEDEIEISVGLSLNLINDQTEIAFDDTYPEEYNFGGSFGGGGLSFRVGAGKYFSRRHFAGLTMDYEVSGDNNFRGGSLRYAYQYDGGTSNMGLYVPIELGYSQLDLPIYLNALDSTDVSGFDYFTDLEVDREVSMAHLGIGHGFQFMLKDKRSIGVEVLIYTGLGINEEYPEFDYPEPETELSLTQFRFSAFVNF